MLIMRANRFVWIPLWAGLLGSLTGCIGGATPPSQFYLLEPLRESESEASAVSEKPAVALSPVKIPRYVDRPQIVAATGPNAYRLSELNRWAESLDDNIGRVLAQNLSRLASVDVVPTNGSGLARQARLRVSVAILEFHVNPEGQAGLTAQWRIARGEDGIQVRQVSYRTPASTSDYQVMVAALNDCLNRMSRELAAAVRQTLAAGNR
ncbi:PqiC family protein [Methylosarcina fibrata]|uniref:PqiC family protein n=1 Tax=Methylosarcina fibrata TaxID=105972 RepID=UPI00037E7757|nr:PqiC family protein [Methylosarcina fibrata]